MCGIAGFVGTRWRSRSEDGDRLLRKMGEAMHNRGPDGEGRWQDERDGVAFVHRRLAIVDLSPTGFQPMTSPSGRYVITYNGEIYNHADLRRELEVSWRGTSDTEVLLAAIDRWGLAGALSRLVGMFAFALWDRETRSLTLARDRFGEKPLYYGWLGEGEARDFVFASDLSALRQHPGFTASIDRAAACSAIRQGHVAGTRSIYAGISKVPPGGTIALDTTTGTLRADSYWSLQDAIKQGKKASFGGSLSEAADRLEALLSDAVSRQMMADVPIGAFLSGGVDSSTIAALMQRNASMPVRTYSIGFRESGYNEAEYAKAVAAHIGSDHTEMFVGAEDALALIPNLPAVYSEPFADASQIPTYLLSKLTREHVTVALSGDAGDELFAGYNRHRLTGSAWRRMQAVPSWMRRAAAGMVLSVPPSAADGIGRLVMGDRAVQVADRVQKSALVLGSRDETELYRRLTSNWTDTDIVIDGHEPADDGTVEALGLDPVEAMMARDALGYLPDDILTKVDRAAMAVSLETRVPLLDHRVAEFAFSLPLEYKLAGGTTKRVLREVLYRHVPRTLIERPKSGFGVPIDAWLRGPLRDWAESLLSEECLRREGILDPVPIRRKWSEHLNGKRNWQQALWNVLMFQAWQEHARA